MAGTRIIRWDGSYACGRVNGSQELPIVSCSRLIDTPDSAEADLISGRRGYVVWLIARELGKPIAEACMEVDQAAGRFDSNAEEARRTYGRGSLARAEHLTQIGGADWPIRPATISSTP
ncbi:hypothetical protein AYJ54_37520 [Bradyrhizobium centrolobii]|uniref:Uncharacterized protein n=1 Tax=Bradyrhizobium centrolobii TaxID=1505087 RepID=A0A176Z9H6_9BRAD|nr:hypothetical protein AYJ54_37520 [Bradyrhizobium centrolobii]